MENFITKLETKNYLIGSFDVYLEKSKELIKSNDPNITDENIEKILKDMPTTYRAAITNKQGEFIGYIGLTNVDAQNSTASIRFETQKQLSVIDKHDILNVFEDYIKNSINIYNIEKTTYITSNTLEISTIEVTPSANIIIPSKFLEPGIDEKTLEKYSEDYTIPKLTFPFTIKSEDKVLGIIGLSNVIWSNKRANLNIFLDKRLGSDIVNELSGYLIDEYVNYAHDLHVHNINLQVSGSDIDKLEILKNTNMNYYGYIPYSSINNGNIESNYLFQHIPEMEKQNGIYLPKNIGIEKSLLNKEKTELDKEIKLNNGYRLVSPKALEEKNIDINNIIDSHIKAMQNRDNFTIPLGEDKYFLQRGNERYGIEKQVKNYTYIVLDENNNYAGFINILRTNADNKNVEIEIATKPDLQGRGLGKEVINAFYNELFKTGVASITSSVFEFNNRSLKLHEKVAELNGIRLESYYVNGNYWDVNLFTKVNDELKQNKTL